MGNKKYILKGIVNYFSNIRHYTLYTSTSWWLKIKKDTSVACKLQHCATCDITPNRVNIKITIMMKRRIHSSRYTHTHVRARACIYRVF